MGKGKGKKKMKVDFKSKGNLKERVIFLLAKQLERGSTGAATTARKATAKKK